MPILADESKHISLSMSQLERLCPVAKALSSPTRAKMISLLSERSMNVNELAEALSLPVSTAALNVRQLEEAGLIFTEIQPGIRGAMKLCSRRIDSVSMRLTPEMEDGINALTVRLPLGCYSSADDIVPECGLVSENAWIGESNIAQMMYHPNRFSAQLIWFHSGSLEYRISLSEIIVSRIEWIEFSLEISSGSPLHREDSESDIFLAVNGKTLGTWECPGDYGGRRGRLNPSWWSDTSSQYGQLKTWRIDADGCRLDGEPLSKVCLADLALGEQDYLSLRVGVDSNAQHVGGLNLFGEKFGDYAQGIMIRVGYAK